MLLRWKVTKKYVNTSEKSGGRRMQWVSDRVLQMSFKVGEWIDVPEVDAEDIFDTKR